MLNRYICIVSGKGGVGKTTSAINLAHIMGKRRKTLLIDANLTTPNAHIQLGAPILRRTLMHVLNKESSLQQAIYTHESGLRILPTISSTYDLKSLKYEKLKDLLKDLSGEADIIIMDAAAGLGKEAITAIEVCDEVLIITNPELSAVLDAQKTIQVAQEIGKTIIGVVVNKVIGDKHELRIDQIEKLLDIPVIGVIPHDPYVRKALHHKQPVSYKYPRSKASKSYEELAGMLLGEKYFAAENKKSKSLYRYALKMLGLK